ncbi:hypothetical protein B0J17DRAFT_712339 [Rhizoctonia solani]|nr:hypothetical protein B0J17DRAFT_712339 [Rhizoctonia solani]
MSDSDSISPAGRSDDLGNLVKEIGRASRDRTKLIVEGFTNLALIAIFFAGVQAQFLSDTNDGNEGALAVATSAAFSGGLIFSVFTAILATLSARWFSILREDDADYLSSRWLAQDSGLKGDIEMGSRHWGPDLKTYLDFQIKSLERARVKKSDVTTSSNDGITNNARDPLLHDVECILNLLHKERIGKPVKFPILDSIYTEQLPMATWKEKALGWALLSPLVVCVPSFVLFTAGILMLAWDKQPRAVAIFTSATVLFCVIPLFFFFLEHRHKHVIRHINLGRASL